MELLKKYNYLNNIISNFLLSRAKYTGIYSTLIPAKQLSIITNGEFIPFLNDLDNFLSNSKSIITIKKNPILFMVIQTYVISNITIKNSNSFYEKFYQEYKVDIKRLQDILKELQEDIWIQTYNNLRHNNINFIIPPSKTYAYRYVQYPLSQVILTTSEMDRLFKKLNINLNNSTDKQLSLNDFKKIVNSNNDIMRNIYENSNHILKNIKFIESQKEIITQQLFSYYITVNFTHDICNRIIKNKNIRINNLYSLELKKDNFIVTSYKNNSSTVISTKSIDNIEFSMSDDGIQYLLWYKTEKDFQWTLTNVIYKKHCEYCIMCISNTKNLKWLMYNFNLKPTLIGKFLFLILNTKNIKTLIELNSNYIDRFFTFPIFYAGNKLARNTYEYKNGPILNINNDNALFLINGIKINDKYFFQKCGVGQYNIHVFFDNHYINATINITKKTDINNMINDNYIYILGEGSYKESNKNITHKYLYLLAGKKIKTNRLLAVMEVNLNANK